MSATLEELWQRTHPAKQAASYVDITRVEFEAWLDSLGMKWVLKSGTQGVYWIPLSKSVAIKVSSSLGTKDKSMGVGRASMQMRMISQVTGQVLNKQLQGVSHFKRTVNWRKNLTEAAKRFKDAYIKSQSFYDALAEIENRDTYKADILLKIESIAHWDKSNMLSDFHTKIVRGQILTVKQKAALGKLSQNTPDVPEENIQVDPKFLERLRKLWVAAKRQGDSWVQEFSESVGKQYKARGSLSAKQMMILEDKFNIFKV